MTEYWRVSGGGNDFLALAAPVEPPSAERIRAWCARGSSLGADGLFILHPGEPLQMDYFNADGGNAALCLNATRCAAQLAFHLGWARGEARITTGAGEIRARGVSSVEVELEVPPPASAPRAVSPRALGSELSGWFLEVGVPHLVVPWSETLARCPVSELGPALRRHPVVGEAGANVDFVRIPSPRELEIRTFERGVEAETLACGTGVLAATAVGLALGRLELPVAARTLGGFVLRVSGRSAEGRVQSWALAGDARVLARATAFPAAELVPSPTAWS